MIVVKDIELMEVPDRDCYTILPSCNELPSSKSFIQEEIIYGIKFYNKNGKIVYIGMSNKVQKVLELPFKIFNDMKEELVANDCRIKSLIEKEDKVIAEVYKYKHMNFWNRLKFLLNKEK